MVLLAAGCLALVLAAIWLVGVTKRLSHHSIWAHEHFSGATLAQFLYVAAQSGIFSFLINYMTSEPPSLPASWLTARTSKWIEVRTAFASSDFKDVSSLAAKLRRQSRSLVRLPRLGALSTPRCNTLAHLKAGTASETAARVAIMQDLNSLILKTNIYSPDGSKGSPWKSRPSNCWRRTPRRGTMRGSTDCCSPTRTRRNSPTRTDTWESPTSLPRCWPRLASSASCSAGFPAPPCWRASPRTRLSGFMAC